MTQTVSFREKFKSGFALFKWELKSCIGTLIVFSVLSSVFIAIALTLSLVIGYSSALSDDGFDYNNVLTALTVFQYITTYMVFFLNAVFTIVYTIRIYSYLHNKRKADLYGSMPISRRTFFISKTVSAYILSVVPTMFFFSVIEIISVAFGQPVMPDIAMFFVKLLVGAIACISFYGLLAVCSGTTLNSVLTFIAINFAYPVTALFIKGTIKAFFVGMPANQYNSSFIMKALNPLSAYDGTHIVYWLIFTALCLFLGIFLVKKRRAECAQTSFAYHLPCYIVELLIAFIIGMFVGTLFGSLNVMLYGYAGFVFGFVLGSAPALFITHLILYKGFSKLWKSAIPYGGLVVTVVLLMAFCNFDVLGYNNYVPAESSVKSAGIIEMNNCYCSKTKGSFGLASMASDDFEDSDSIKTITDFHRSAVKAANLESNEKFSSIWANMLLSNIPSEYFENGYCVAYRLNNGRLTYRFYDSTMSYSMFSYDNDSFDTKLADKITSSDTYFKNYSAIMNNDINSIKMLDLDYSGNRLSDDGYDDYYYYSYNSLTLHIESGSDISDQKADADRKKILEAYRKDVEAVGRHDDDSELFTIAVQFEVPEKDGLSPSEQLISLIESDYGRTYYGTIWADYSNTLAALREAGIINSNNSVNKSCPYYINSNPDKIVDY